MKRVNPELYTKEYYLQDCSGYKEFVQTWGKNMEERLKTVAKNIPSVKGLRVLDVGCGRGELALWAAEAGALSVVGIDYSKNAIVIAETAKKHFPKTIQKKVKFIKIDANRIKFKSNSFDLIIVSEVVEHLYPEQLDDLFKRFKNILSKKGLLVVHTAPNKYFNDIAYKYWCYPLSSLLVKLNNTITGSNYPNILPPSALRTESHLVMHINEPTYFSLRKLFESNGFKGRITSTNITVNKPILGWKDAVFNFIVYLYPISNYPPFNILWGNDFLSVLKNEDSNFS